MPHAVALAYGAEGPQTFKTTPAHELLSPLRPFAQQQMTGHSRSCPGRCPPALNATGQLRTQSLEIVGFYPHLQQDPLVRIKELGADRSIFAASDLSEVGRMSEGEVRELFDE